MSKTVSNDVKNYLKFCTMFGLTQIIKSPTRITCSSTSLIDHILESLPDRDYFEDVHWAYSDLFQKLMTVIDNLAPYKTKRVKGNPKVDLMEKYLKNVGQRTNSLKRSRKRGFISIKNYIKRLHTTHKRWSQQKNKRYLIKNFQKVFANQKTME